MIPLETALERYKNALKFLTTPNSYPNKNQVIEILSARDALGKLLETENSISASILSDILSELITQDSLLKKQAYKIAKVLDLADYRDALLTPPEVWWWHLDKVEDSHPWNRFDWLWKALKLTAWTGNLALFATLATRFLSGGSGLLEATAIAFPAILSLLQAQSELTEVGQKSFDKLLAKLNIPQHFHEEAKLVSTVLITGFLLLIWVSQPFFSEIYKQTGKNNQENQQLVAAEQQYLKAIALDSDNFDAHYKLATLYEELQDIDKAKKEYLIAAKGGHLDAYNNLAYWYIRQDKDAEAINLLNKGLKFVAEREKNLEKLTDAEKLDLTLLQYNLYKNLGWARFEQKRNEDARPYLLAAIGIANNPKYMKYIRNPGAAYCLYAQLLERAEAKSSAMKPSQQPSQAKQYWQECRELIKKRLASGEEINPEEDSWLYKAKKK